MYSNKNKQIDVHAFINNLKQLNDMSKFLIGDLKHKNDVLSDSINCCKKYKYLKSKQTIDN